ncbi:MAG TPA: hypothetical protein PLI17_05675, partial [Denitromonas sp.]|nr:hypothetical protein [Denitromonas sp.]
MTAIHRFRRADYIDFHLKNNGFLANLLFLPAHGETALGVFLEGIVDPPLTWNSFSGSSSSVRKSSS